MVSEPTFVRLMAGVEGSVGVDPKQATRRKKGRENSKRPCDRRRKSAALPILSTTLIIATAQPLVKHLLLRALTGKKARPRLSPPCEWPRSPSRLSSCSAPLRCARMASRERSRSSGCGSNALHDNRMEVRNVNFYYGETRALHDVSLGVKDRQITALIGPSGCGKSTFLPLLNRMNDLIPGTRLEGSVLLDGQDIYAPDVDVVDLRRRVGMVFQRPNPFPQSIYANVAFGPRVLGLEDDLDRVVETSLRAAALWDEVRDKLNSSALGLADGKQQRLCLARVLAVEPEVILLDEPCSALDPVDTLEIEG